MQRTISEIEIGNAYMTLEPRIIKNNDQYRLYLAEIERLAAEDPDADSVEGARLELLAKLAEDYEKTQFALFSFREPRSKPSSTALSLTRRRSRWI